MSRLSPELEEFLAHAQRGIEQALRKIIAPEEDSIRNLDDGLEYALGLDPGAPNQGKRIRPVLCLLVCERLSGRIEPALPFAVGIELMHNFALVHDDIEDGDEFRRGRPAVWKQFGLPHGINIGDYLFTKISKALSWNPGGLPADVQVRLFSLMGDTLDHTHRGQALDMNAREEKISIAQYMKLVTEKTGYYLAAPLIAGAVAAGADAAVENALQRFGLSIGPMFQIRDDLIDLTHGKGRAEIGSDICEGKRSFLAAHVFENGSAENIEELIHILNLARKDTKPQHIKRAIDIFEAGGAMAEAERRCAELKKEAMKSLAGLPDNLRTWLTEITESLASRTA